MDGQLVRFDHAVVHITSPILLRAIGVFEGIRAYPGKGKEDLYLFRLREHIERFFNSMAVYRLKTRTNFDEISKAVMATVKANNLHRECYVRPFAYLSKGEPYETSIAITVREMETRLGRPDFENGLRCMVSSWRRIAPDALPSKAKCIANYANGFLARTEAQENGFDDAILLDHRGFVSEGMIANIFMIKKEQIITPPLHASTLDGITRRTIITLARDLRYDIVERDVTRVDMYSMEEIFLCGSRMEIAPVVEVDNMRIGARKPGSITKKLASYYYKIVSGKVPNYKVWLTPVYQGTRRLCQPGLPPDQK